MSSDRFGVRDALFSVKCLVAAMLAYYIALRIGLPRPSWAVLTAYIVSQPLAGAVLSKALFRVLGTVLGATMAVILVPNLVNSPELLTLALALWLGVCIYFGLLDRTPRSYIFLLAGYTASIIGFPSVSAPDAIFTTAILRVQEITLGILCASLLHGVVLPQTVTSRLIARVDTILGDAARWSSDTLNDRLEATLNRDRRRLAVDIFDLHQLSIHLPFDMARLQPRISVVRALQDQISLILPLGAACLDRIEQLRAAGAMPETVEVLLADTRQWLESGARSDGEAKTLASRARMLEPAAPSSWTAMLLANLLVRLNELIRSHSACGALRTLIADPHAIPPREIEAVLRRAGHRPLHRDHGVAIRSALGVATAVVLLCTVWIATAWPDGASAALIAGAVGAILASIGGDSATGWKLLIGAVVATMVCLLYDFAIFPRVTDFAPLVMVLAPTLLLMGGMMTMPPTAPYALGFMVTLPTSIGLVDRYSSSLDALLNGNMAQFAGMAAPVISLTLFASIDGNMRARKLLHVTRRDLARRCLSRARPRTERWLATMLDRVAYLYPHVARGEASSDTLEAILADTRAGINIDELRRIRGRRGLADTDVAIGSVLVAVHDHLRSAGSSAPGVGEDARLQLDRLLARSSSTLPQDAARALSLALVGLRRSLFPDAAAPLLETQA